jgi:hypothetical protein
MSICTLVMTPKRIAKLGVAIAKSTLLNFHKALRDRKYSRLFSRKTKSKLGPKGPSKEFIKLIVETRERNPSCGCARIALHVGNVLGEPIDARTARLILASESHFTGKAFSNSRVLQFLPRSLQP